jgi:DNA-binding transcriptional ArsR family regulator
MKKDVFQAIADPTRRAILILLATHAMTPNTVAEKFNVSRQAVSKHIHVLEECQLLRKQKSGREIFYHYNPDKMKEVDHWLGKLRQSWEDRFAQLDQVLIQLKDEKK